MNLVSKRFRILVLFYFLQKSSKWYARYKQGVIFDHLFTGKTSANTYGKNDDHDVVLLVGGAVLFMWDLLDNVEDLFRGFSSGEGDISDGDS